MTKQPISGRKLVLSCVGFLTLLMLLGVVWVRCETSRARERREVLFNATEFERMKLDFVGDASPSRVSPAIEADGVIVYWEVYTLAVHFDDIVTKAAAELDRIDHAFQPPSQRSGTWAHNGPKLQVLILKDAALPGPGEQGDRDAFPDLPPLLNRQGSVIVRVNYKRP